MKSESSERKKQEKERNKIYVLKKEKEKNLIVPVNINMYGFTIRYVPRANKIPFANYDHFGLVLILRLQHFYYIVFSCCDLFSPINRVFSCFQKLFKVQNKIVFSLDGLIKFRINKMARKNYSRYQNGNTVHVLPERGPGILTN